ncbi:MAG: hypothetical protein HOQ03_03285, partial [Thermoleophilia bacterium]|nr:hypothetical protein [Thermoleophilia bacterium]
MSGTRAIDVVPGLACAVVLALLASSGIGPTAAAPPRVPSNAETSPGLPAPSPDRGFRATDVRSSVQSGVDASFHEPMTFTWTADVRESGVAPCREEPGSRVPPHDTARPAPDCTAGGWAGLSHTIVFRRYDGAAPTLEPVAVPGVVARDGVLA